MGVIYQATDDDFNFFESQTGEFNAERNQSIMTSIFRTLTGTRYKTRRRQVTGIPQTPITLGAASPTVIPSVAAYPGTPVTNTNPCQETSKAALDAPAAEELELSVPETALPVTTASNEGHFGASYLNNCAHQTTPNNNISMCSSDSFAQGNLNLL